MFKRLMILGGILNSFFFLFHAFLGYRIHRLASVHRGTLQSFNIAGTLSIFFFAYASFAHQKDLQETRLGHAVLALASLIYLSRAAEEFILFKFTAGVFASCFIVGALYATALVIAVKKKPTNTIQQQITI